MSENLEKLKTLMHIKSKEQVKPYNPQLLYKIQPAGGLSFNEWYIKKGDGYETCIDIYEYVSHVSEFWLYDIFNMKNVITTIDIAPTEQSEVVSNINNSLREQLERFYNDRDEIQRISAQQKYQEISEIFKQISRSGEVVKRMSVRIYVSAKELQQLEEKVRKVLETLEASSFKGTIFLNEVEYEWKSLFSSASKIAKFPNRRIGKEIGARTIAAGYPFHYTKLNDPFGTYLGTTNTGGNVLFDMFHKDKQRKYYNGVIVGTMGSGKSTTLKKLLLDNAIRGNIIRGFDVTGEFEELISGEDGLHGKCIALDGTNGIINPLEVMRTSDKESVSFMQHLSKLSTIYKFLSPGASDELSKEFELLARKLYIKCGLWKENLSDEEQKITGLNSKEYPVYSDFLKLVQEELYLDLESKKIREEISENRVERLESIELTLKSLVNNYGYLFNGHSTIEDITNEQIVFFSIRNLTSMKKEIFNAQMYNALNILWDNMLKNGQKYKKLYDTNSVKWEDIVRYLIIIDEAHRIINTDNLLAVKFLVDFEREARKYFAGLFFASPSIRSFVPEGSSSDAVNEIKTLFELTQYKFVMQQDSNSLKTLRTIFDGSLSESELERIPKLTQGECILSINSFGNISFTIEASPRELKLFQGGA